MRGHFFFFISWPPQSVQRRASGKWSCLQVGFVHIFEPSGGSSLEHFLQKTALIDPEPVTVSFIFTPPNKQKEQKDSLGC